MRVRVEPLDAPSVAALAWLEEAARWAWPVSEPRDRLARWMERWPRAGWWAISRDGETCGVVATAAVDGLLWFPAAFVRSDVRGYGLGGEAIVELEERLGHDAGAAGFRTALPVDAGFAVYFWLRMGYRPEPARGRGLLVMTRAAAGAVVARSDGEQRAAQSPVG